MKRLIKKSELIDGVTCNGDIAYIYKNPTSKEIDEIKKEKSYDAVRGIITKSNDIYAWNGNYLHDNVLSQI